VEALMLFPTRDTRDYGFSSSKSQLLNLNYLRLVGVDLEGPSIEEAPVPFHRLLGYWIHNCRNTVPGLGVGRLKLEIHNSGSYDTDDGSPVMADLQAIRELVDELYVGDSA